MEGYTMFLYWKNQYCENDSTTQSNLQIQCNPYLLASLLAFGNKNNVYIWCGTSQGAGGQFAGDKLRGRL